MEASRHHNYFHQTAAQVPDPVSEGGSSWAQHEPAALTLRAGTSRQQPAGRPPSSSHTGVPACNALNISNKFLPGC
ncbi:hypothetical protein E3U43_004297 [Larimichthys crocea]|uniref:Uncharacterized protein n=1 Tax=Larimichthys crocea TaxID=215358 RepID=A0ACD3QCU3_LARCR|nr:hypothetical protein E3U43_004297 [Larimichthys crocea]